MTKDIQKWLNQFKANWKNQDIDSVLELFTEGVEYHETPTKTLRNKKKIREEWQNIKDQKDIKLDLKVWSRDGDSYTVKWRLEYMVDAERKVLNGIYLIKLNEEGKCAEFWQYCQVE